MTLDQLTLYTRYARKLGNRRLAELTHVAAMGARGEDKALREFMRSLEGS